MAPVDPNKPQIGGTYGDVRRAEYRKPWWAFWTSPKQVAVKILRPAGDEVTRVKVAVVSLHDWVLPGVFTRIS